MTKLQHIPEHKRGSNARPAASELAALGERLQHVLSTPPVDHEEVRRLAWLRDRLAAAQGQAGAHGQA